MHKADVIIHRPKPSIYIHNAYQNIHTHIHSFNLCGILIFDIYLLIFNCRMGPSSLIFVSVATIYGANSYLKNSTKSTFSTYIKAFLIQLDMPHHICVARECDVLHPTVGELLTQLNLVPDEIKKMGIFFPF